MLESSNVNAAQSLVNMIELQRLYEFQIKSINSSDTERAKRRALDADAHNPQERNHGSCIMGREDRARRAKHPDGGDRQQPREQQHDRLSRPSRAAFQDLMYQNMQQVGAQSTAEHSVLDRPLARHRRAHRADREELRARQRAADQRRPGPVGHRHGLLPDHDARRHARLHARRLVLAGLSRQRRQRERLSDLTRRSRSRPLRNR